MQALLFIFDVSYFFFPFWCTEIVFMLSKQNLMSKGFFVFLPVMDGHANRLKISTKDHLMSKGCFFFFWHNGWPYKSLQKLVWKICWANSWFLLFLTIDLFRILISPLRCFLALEKKTKKEFISFLGFFGLLLSLYLGIQGPFIRDYLIVMKKRHIWFMILYINLYMFLNITIKTWVIYLLRHVVLLDIIKHWFLWWG